VAIFLVGLNHRTAPLELRERVALSGDGLRRALDELRDNPGVQEAVIVSTCNRLELYIEGVAEAAAQLPRFMVGHGDQAVEANLYCLEGAEAARHLLRVASGLDSAILGETQVLGQVGEALEIAQEQHASGAIMSHLFAHAVHTGKRARSETEISRHTTSVSQVAAKLAQDWAGRAAKVLIVGAGEMATLAAQALSGHEITVINRSYGKAARLARQVGGRALDWLQFGSALAWADVVISATSAPHSIIRAGDLAERARPILLIDTAMPHDIDPNVRGVAGVELWTLDDLQARVEANLAQRSAAVAPVEAIVEAETALFMEWLSSREVAPVITDLQRWARMVAEGEIAQALSRLDAPDAHTEAVIERLAHRLVGKLLHEPTVRLKHHAAEGAGQDYAAALRDLFGLEANA
jgi:glutamyl-tRNA reductase